MVSCVDKQAFPERGGYLKVSTSDIQNENLHSILGILQNLNPDLLH